MSDEFEAFLEQCSKPFQGDIDRRRYFPTAFPSGSPNPAARRLRDNVVAIGIKEFGSSHEDIACEIGRNLESNPDKILECASRIDPSTLGVSNADSLRSVGRRRFDLRGFKFRLLGRQSFATAWC